MTNQIKGEMKNLLNRIEQLENSVLTDYSIQSKEQLQQALDDFEIYFDNITDMSKKLDISMIFLKELSKDVKHIKSSIDQILQNVSDIANDVRRLRGKNFVELLLIRKKQILKQKDENELYQIHIEIYTQEYDPVSGNKKQSQNQDKTSYLLKKSIMILREKQMNFYGMKMKKLKMYCFQKEKQVKEKAELLKIQKNYYGVAIKQNQNGFQFMFHCHLLKIQDIIQLIKHWNHKIITLIAYKQEILRRQQNKKIQVFYDEMKQDCLEQNLYNSNRFVQEFNLTESGQNFKIIITSRQEILNSIDYQTWFYGKSISTLKEVELVPFNSDQSNEYLTQYSKVSVKRAIKRFYEFLKQLKAQSFSFNEFKIIWSQIEETVKKILLQKLK
ncbi:unnamed protein product [Paramecium pentaurelia]|uniref:Uncharacterized protein n=1 Tax=Paramecium pentaurelia TaxID=43138 RepID=A0A8S1YMR8_9CILI|nr:unnamed protein product [Paramecium pentaurelia]